MPWTRAAGFATSPPFRRRARRHPAPAGIGPDHWPRRHTPTEMGTRREFPAELEPPSRSPYAAVVPALGGRLVAAQRTVRVLEAVAWDRAVETAFFAAGERELPPVGRDYYLRRPLPFDPAAKRREFLSLERDARYRLGAADPAGRVL